MSSFATWVKKERPDIYGTFSDDEIDRRVGKALAEPEGRARLATHLRKDFKSLSAYDDDAVLAGVERQVKPPTDDPVLRRARAVYRDGRDTYREARKAAREVTKEQAKFPSDEVQEKVHDFYDNVPHPKSMDKEGKAVRFPTHSRWETFEAESRKPGHRIAMQDGGDQPIVVNEKGAVVAALQKEASLDPEKVPGMNIVPRLVGTGSQIQQLVARGMRLTPEIEAILGKRDDPGGGYGFRELGMDLGEAMVPMVPDLSLAEKAYSYVPSAALRSAQKIDEAEEWGYRKIADLTGSKTVAKWANENAAEAKKYRNKADDVASFREYLDKAKGEDEKQEIQKQAGIEGGAYAGEIASLIAPTEASPLGAAVGKAVSKVGAPIARKAAGAFTDTKAGHKVAGWFSDIQSSWGASPAQRLAVQSAAAAGRNAVDVGDRMMRDDMKRALAPIYEKHGLGDDAAQDKLLREVLDSWHSPETRRAAGAAAHDAFDVLQPMHRQVFDYAKGKGVMPEGVRYNPFHLMHDQKFWRSARMNESAGAQVQEALGQVPWSAKFYSSADVADVPGVRRILRHHEYPGIKGPGAGAVPDGKPRLPGVVTDPGDGMDFAAMRPLRGNGGVADLAAARLKVAGKLSDAELKRFKQEYEDLNALSGISGSARALLEDTGYRTERSAQELLRHMPTLKAEAPDSFKHIDELLPRRPAGEASEIIPSARWLGDGGRSAVVPKNLGRNAKGQVIHGDRLLPLELQARFKKNDEVIIRAGKALHSEGRGAIDNFHLNLPAAYRDMDGMVVPRRFAHALQEMSTPSSQLMSGKARDVAQGLDRWIGLAQMKEVLTRGNMGFQWRNRLSEVMRVLVDEGRAAMSPETRRLVAEITSSALGIGGKKIRIGDQVHDVGQLHRRLAELGILREKGKGELSGSGKLLEAVRLDGVVDKLHGLAMKPGLASEAAADAAFRQPFSVAGRKLAAQYQAEDGIRLLSVVSKMKRGVPLEKAVQDTKNLLIDYADKNAAEIALGSFIPFIKYYSGAIQGALKLAVTQPHRFANVARVARHIEAQDQALHDGAVDPRLKPRQETASMAPMYQTGDRNLTALRPETPWAELVNLFAMLPGVGFSERGLGALLTPFIGNAYASATGRDIGTDRSLPKDQMARADAGAFDQFWQAREDQEAGRGNLLGANPLAHAAYLAAKHAPLIGGRILTPQVEAVLRGAMDLGGHAASRSPDSTVGYLQRSVPSAMVGVRQTRIDPPTQLQRKSHEASNSIPPTVREQMRKEKRKGVVR